MIGPILGDIAGSRFEWNNHRSKDFTLLAPSCFFTDDSILSLAVCDALMKTAPSFEGLGKQAVLSMHQIGRPYPDCGYGGSFYHWMYGENPRPYNSFGNGAAMRIGGCGWAAGSLEEAKKLSRAVTEITHNHPEGLKGAEAVATAVYLARTGASKEQIRSWIAQNYYPLDFTLDSIRDTYQFNETCQNTVPQALEAFFESENFEDALRNAVSIGGDSDTLAAITGSVAEAFYGVPKNLRAQGMEFLDLRLKDLLERFEAQFGSKMESGPKNPL